MDDSMKNLGGWGKNEQMSYLELIIFNQQWLIANLLTINNY